MKEEDAILNYAKFIDEAMHDVVRKSLTLVAEFGLPDDHHFFITFDTNHPDVMISDELRAQYKDEMTIVLQHQFWDLEIDNEKFSIVLSFDNVKQNLTVPFEALIAFADPAVKFGLQFNYSPLEGDDYSELVSEEGATLEVETKSDGSNVISLDSFRKK